MYSKSTDTCIYVHQQIHIYKQGLISKFLPLCSASGKLISPGLTSCMYKITQCNYCLALTQILFEF